MADDQALNLLRSGVKAWNDWRRDTFGQAQARLAQRWHYKPPSPSAHPDLSYANLPGLNLMNCDLNDCDLSGANLGGANLTGADMRRVNLRNTDLRGAILDMADLTSAHLVAANLVGAHLHGTLLRQANLSNANLATSVLVEADFRGATMNSCSLYASNLIQANFQSADLRGSDLQSALMVDAVVEDATLSGCLVYGLSAWRLRGIPAEQSDLVITPNDESRVTVGDLAIAQFVYLLLNNSTIRQVIDSISSKAVLILGRFTTDRKSILNAIKQQLQRMNYVPIVFDFEKPTHRDFTETIMTLAGMCMFMIADITNPKSSPLELQAIVPNYMVPLVPILQQGEAPFSMFVDLQNKFDWILDVRIYDTEENLISHLEQGIVRPALEKHSELLTRKAERLRSVNITEC